MARHEMFEKAQSVEDRTQGTDIGEQGNAPEGQGRHGAAYVLDHGEYRPAYQLQQK